MVILNRTNRRKDGCKQDRQFSKPEIKIRQLYPVSTLRRQNIYIKCLWMEAPGYTVD